MLLKIVGDAVALAQIKAANQEPLIVVDPSVPFDDPATSSKFAAVLGCDPSSTFQSLGLQMSAGSASDPRAVDVHLHLSPEQQGMRTGTMLYLTRDTKPFAYPLSSPTPTSEPPPQSHGTPGARQLSAPVDAAWVRSASSPVDSRHMAPVLRTAPAPQYMSQTPLPQPTPGAAVFQQEAPRTFDQTPQHHSTPWDITSQMEEAAAKRRAQQIMGDFMRNRTRVGELEAELADARREVVEHRETIGSLEKTLRDTELYRDEMRHGAADTDDLKKQVYDLKKDNLELRKANALYDRKEREQQAEVEKLQLGVDAAEERGKLSMDKRLSATQEELLEAKAFIDALKERLIAQAAELKKLQSPEANEPHTEHIILPPGMLRKLVTVNGGGVQYYRDKFNLEISLLENTMTVVGDPVDIKLLKEECEHVLGLTDPNNAAAAMASAFPDTDVTNPRVRDLLEKEQELLALNADHRQQLQAAQSTIESLHLALKHAQGRVESDLESTRELREVQMRETRRRGDELDALKAQTQQLQKELQAKSVALEDANKALNSTIETFQLEFERSKSGKEEVTMLRSLIAKKDEEVKAAKQEQFLTKQQLDDLTVVKCDLEKELSIKRDLEGRVPTLEASFVSAQREADVTRDDLAKRCEDWGAEKGILLEKNQRLQEALDSAVAQLEETRRLREDLRLSRLKEEELVAKIRAMELSPQHRLSAEHERDAMLLRDDAARATRENRALADSLEDCKRRYEVLLSENERVKRDYIVAMDKVTQSEIKVAELYSKLEENRLVALQESSAAEREIAMLRHQAVAASAGAEAAAMHVDMQAAAAKPYTITPHMPTTEATALVDAMRAELEAKKRQLSRSQALLLGSTSPPSATAVVKSAKSVSPYRRGSQVDLCDISPAKPVSPPPASSIGFVSPSSPRKRKTGAARTSPQRKKWVS